TDYLCDSIEKVGGAPGDLGRLGARKGCARRMKVRKAVIPAAGLGTRFLPATKTLPKEMLPVVDKPVIQYIVEEAVASGIEQIVIVTSQGKRTLEDHFDYAYELEHRLAAGGKPDLRDQVRAIANLAEFVYVRLN